MTKKINKECPHCLNEFSPKQKNGAEYQLCEPCSKQLEDEMKIASKESYDEHQREVKKSNKLLKRLKKTLPAKIFKAIEWLQDSFVCYGFQIVERKDTTGVKQKASLFFDQSSAVRYVYDDTSYCSYDDAGGGVVFIRVDKLRFVKVYV